MQYITTGRHRTLESFPSLFLSSSQVYTPSPGAYVHHLWLGTVRPDGTTGRRSLPAETLNSPNAIIPMAVAANPVFLFQCAGLFHQPPEGDHTYGVHQREGSGCLQG
jgi:hypothetical protein